VHVLALGSLLVALLMLLAAERRGVADPAYPRGGGHGRAGLLALLAAVTVANLPLVLATPRLAGALLPADAFSHAVVAQAVARKGLPHGWVDVYAGGFPFGIHYQSVALLMDAALIKLAVPAMIATNVLGIAALLATPLSFAWATHRCGLHPLASLAGAIFLTTVAPAHAMVGGWESYVSQGLLSQVVTIPIVILCAGAVVSSQSMRWVPWIAALAVAAHTQVTIAAFAAALPAVLVAGTPDVRRRFLVASVGGAIAALALYGTGALTYAVPFSYPTKTAPWRLYGFAFDRLADGDLLDDGRAPILTTASIVSAAFLLPLVRSRAARGALICVAVASLVTFGRDAFLSAGPFVHAIIEIMPPARMMVIVPLAAALSVSVALHELDARTRLLVASARARSVPAWLGGAPQVVCVVAIAALTLPGRVAWMRGLVTSLGSLTGTNECGPSTPDGYATRDVMAWIAGLDRGRFVTDAASFPDACPAEHGVDLASPVPLGYNVGGPGTQVGVLMTAYSSLGLEWPASAGRAEVLGVRDVLATREHATQEDGWRVRESRGDTLLLERIGGGDFFGAGCVVEEWTGSGRLLRDALVSDLEARAPWRSDPSRLVAVTDAAGPVLRRAVDLGGCDASRASIVEHRREPGAYEAVVTSPSDVDVVVRATYFPTWEVRVDGALVAKRRVAPGFVSARVPAGTHRVEAVVQLPRGSLVALLVACVCLAFLGGVPRLRVRT
jgi:hypothetical protein